MSVLNVGSPMYRHQRTSLWQVPCQPGNIQQIEQADFIVAHAGMGTILSALEIGIPILVFSLHNAGALIDVALGNGDFTVISDGG